MLLLKKKRVNDIDDQVKNFISTAQKSKSKSENETDTEKGTNSTTECECEHTVSSDTNIVVCNQNVCEQDERRFDFFLMEYRKEIEKNKSTIDNIK